MIGMAGQIFDKLCATNKAKAEELRSEHKANGFSALGVSDDIGPTIAKIPLRAEVRDMLRAADLYEEHADRHRGEMERLEKMARDARTQAHNLERMADL